MSTTGNDSFEAFLREAARTPDVSSGQPRIPSGVKLAGRFSVLFKLGHGGMGQVFAAYDEERRTRVALKVIGQLRPELIGQLKQEFRAAAGLLHPNLVRLHELFFDGNEWFFTMELVEGDVLPVVLGRAGHDTTALLRSLLAQLAAGVAALHRSGTLHRDLKPSNFLITADEGRVVLLDFGLAMPARSTEPQDGSGTPLYMAPEQKCREPLTEAADWYAFGGILHEALTGHVPEGGALSPLLDRADSELAELSRALLAQDPARRPTGPEVLAALGVRDSAPSLPPPVPPQFVGRARELATLNAAYHATLEGRPGLVLVHGPSGIGKTSLVRAFLDGLDPHAGALVLSGRCRERETLGYKAVDGLVDGLTQCLDRMPVREAAALLPPGAFDLARLFPALGAAPCFEYAQVQEAVQDPSDQARQRMRAIAAFGHLLDRLREGGPVVLWLDDLQWSDTDSALLLGPLLSGLSARPILLIGSVRSGPSGMRRGPLLDALYADRTVKLPSPVEIPLGPLASEDARRMATELLPPLDSRAASIAHDAAGHPLFIVELAQLCASTETFESRGSAPRAPISLDSVIRERVCGLAPDAQQLLELLAVAGGPLPRGLLRRTGALSPATFEELADVLRASQLVHTLGMKAPDLVDIHHDRVREVVVESMTEVRRRQHHLRLARTLEASEQDLPARRAAHYEAGGDPQTAGVHWIVAADQAMQTLAFAHAADLYGRALALASLDANERRRLELRRADALILSGRGSAAAEIYLTQAGLVAPDEGVELRRRAAQQLLLSGHLDRGLEEIERVLGASGMRGTRGGRAAILPLLLGRALVRLSGLRHVPRTENELPREELARLDAAWTSAWSLALVDPIRGAEFQTRFVRMALRAGEPQRLARALVLEACYVATAGPAAAPRTRHLLQAVEQLAVQHGGEEPASLLAVARGIAAYLQGDNGAALQRFDEAMSRLDRHGGGEGSVWERMSAQRLMIASLFHVGRFERLAGLVPPLLGEFEGAGNLYATASFRTGYSTVAWLAQDMVSEADRHLEIARRETEALGFHLVHSNLLLGQTFRDLYVGEGVAAHERIESRFQTFVDSQYLRIAVLRVQAWQMRGGTAVLAAVEWQAKGQDGRARACRSAALRAARALRRQPLTRGWAMAALIEGAVDQAEGRDREASAQLRVAIDRFEAEDMRMYAAAARFRLGRLLGGDAGREQLDQAFAQMQLAQIVDSERIVRMLAPGWADA